MMVLQKSIGCTKDWLRVNGLYVCGKTKLRSKLGVRGYGRGEERRDGE